MKYKSEKKSDRIMDRLNYSLNNHKYKKKQKTKKTIISKKNALILIYLPIQAHSNCLLVYQFLYTIHFRFVKFWRIYIWIKFGELSFITTSLQ